MTEGPILVTGAGGVLGRAVMETLRSANIPARGLGRRPPAPDFPAEWFRADLRAGEGLQAALHGADAVIHCASNPHHPAEDLTALQHLIEAAKSAHLRHLVFVGIAGIERAAATFPYYATKLKAEALLATSNVPHTVVRATQFHPFAAYLLQRLDAKLAVITPRAACLQPVSPDFTAARLVHHALASPTHRAPDIHGPQIIQLAHLARTWLKAKGRHAPAFSLPLPFGPFKTLSLLEPVTGDTGGQTWAEWLNRRATQTNPYTARA